MPKQMQGYVYYVKTLRLLCENKEKLGITDALALQILWELYPFTPHDECQSRDFAHVDEDQVRALRCLKYEQKCQLNDLITKLAWYLEPDWDWTGPSKAHLTSTPHHQRLETLLTKLTSE
jgi:hypothetical protein